MATDIRVITGHRYTVEFRIFGETVDPDTITNELDLVPCQVRADASRRADGKVFKGMWGFDGDRNDGSWQHDWSSLEDGLTYLLDKLWSKRKALEKYAAHGQLVWWCGHFQSSFGGGPELSPSLLSRLGEFGAALYIDNYFSDDE